MQIQVTSKSSKVGMEIGTPAFRLRGELFFENCLYQGKFDNLASK